MKLTHTMTAAVLATGMTLSLAGCGSAASSTAPAASSSAAASSEAVLPADTMTVHQLLKSVNTVAENDVIDAIPGTFETRYEYDEYGYLVTKSVDDYAGTEVFTYEYDAAGNEIWMRDRLYDNAETDTFTTSTYNADGQKIGEIYTIGEKEDAMTSETVYTYSADLPAVAKNLPATKTVYDGLAIDGSLLSATEYVYDENYFLVSEICTFFDDSVMTTVYENDENGNPITTTCTNENVGETPITTEMKAEYTYNEEGEMLSEISDNNPLTIAYTYDEAGYRLTETYTDSEGNVVVSVTNTYEDVTVKLR